MTSFTVIGIDDSQSPNIPLHVQKIIARNTVFSGGTRHHQIMQSKLPNGYQWIDIVVPIDAIFEQYDKHQHVVVFASGDPLFFGFANTIQRLRPQAQIALYPSFNSLQLLAHRLLLPYQDMHIVSLTGRPWHKFDEALIRGEELIGLLTDNKLHTPHTIVQRMLDYGYDNYKIAVGELLGNEEKEVFAWYDMKDVLTRHFQFPNNIILKKTSHRPHPFGIPDSAFHLLNGRAKMITKMPIRLLSLSALNLSQSDVFWDVGFCTGSVSVEAKLQFPHLHVYAFEIRIEGDELIQLNAQRFGTPGIMHYIGDFLEQNIEQIPAPDAVFIGGHGGKLVEMTEKICTKLKSNGIIVFNSVSTGSYEMFLEAVEQNALVLEQDTRIVIDDFNPIHVLKARKIENKV